MPVVVGAPEPLFWGEGTGRNGGGGAETGEELCEWKDCGRNPDKQTRDRKEEEEETEMERAGLKGDGRGRE